MRPSPLELKLNDAVLALISLGYKQVDALKAVKTIQEEAGEAEVSSEDLVRQALRKLL
jgi:Holliday junction resolvasome RuvABC DNA-binding subunit